MLIFEHLRLAFAFRELVPFWLFPILRVFEGMLLKLFAHYFVMELLIWCYSSTVVDSQSFRQLNIPTLTLRLLHNKLRFLLNILQKFKFSVTSLMPFEMQRLRIFPQSLWVDKEGGVLPVEDRFNSPDSMTKNFVTFFKRSETMD